MRKLLSNSLSMGIFGLFFGVMILSDVAIAQSGYPAPNTPQVDCRWNNYNWQPYVRDDYQVYGHFVGNMNNGFQFAKDCQQTVALQRDHAVCNWNGIGFTPYDIVSNWQVVPFTFATISDCYDGLPHSLEK